MPRASSIWVVHSAFMHYPVAAFTVRHEMVSWFKRQVDPSRYIVYRIRDGEEYVPSDGHLTKDHIL